MSCRFNINGKSYTAKEAEQWYKQYGQSDKVDIQVTTETVDTEDPILLNILAQHEQISEANDNNYSTPSGEVGRVTDEQSGGLS
jgi:hypothetical protein